MKVRLTMIVRLSVLDGWFWAELTWHDPGQGLSCWVCLGCVYKLIRFVVRASPIRGADKVEGRQRSGVQCCHLVYNVFVRMMSVRHRHWLSSQIPCY